MAPQQKTIFVTHIGKENWAHYCAGLIRYLLIVNNGKTIMQVAYHQTQEGSDSVSLQAKDGLHSANIGKEKQGKGRKG